MTNLLDKLTDMLILITIQVFTVIVICLTLKTLSN
jgi:hypothetical protein